MCKIVIPQYIAYVKSNFSEEGAPLILRSSFTSRATIFQSTPSHGFNSFASNCRLDRVIFYQKAEWNILDDVIQDGQDELNYPLYAYHCLVLGETAAFERIGWQDNTGADRKVKGCSGVGQNMGWAWNARRDMFSHDRLGHSAWACNLQLLLPTTATCHYTLCPSTSASTPRTTVSTGREIEMWPFRARRDCVSLLVVVGRLCSPEALALCWVPASPGSLSMGSSFLRRATASPAGPSRRKTSSITITRPASQTSWSKSNWSRLWSGSRTLYAASAAPVRAVPSCLLQAAAAQGRIGGGVGQATCPVSSKAHHHPPPTDSHRHPHRRRQRHRARRRLRREVPQGDVGASATADLMLLCKV